MEMNLLAVAKDIVGEYWHLLIPAAGVIGTGIFSFIRRSKSSATDGGPYFTEATLLSPPLTRPAYSDRMAYVLAEMSALAYYQFEDRLGLVDDEVDNALSRDLTDAADVREFLDAFSTKLMGGRRLSLKHLRKILQNSGFVLLDIINVGETQGFVCKRVAENEPPYLVLSFRGTEKKFSDWATDARCIPTVAGKSKVHTGFLEAFTSKSNADGRSVREAVREILARDEAKDENNKALPLFITGHSLGGALALLTTKLIAPNINGACYTFGAPRVGNYEYFQLVKTPVYRVVNSSDIVPRLPPGAGMWIVISVFRALAWLTILAPNVSAMFDKVEETLDKLKGYRHFGDLRYLSDVAEGRFDKVRLLSNPPMIDRIIWMSQALRDSIYSPVRGHGMHIYRRKLLHIANVRGGREYIS